MGTRTAVVPAKRSGLAPEVVLIAGWIVPGLGHLLLRRPVRALLLFVSVVAMFSICIALHGKVYSPTTGDPLDLL